MGSFYGNVVNKEVYVAIECVNKDTIGSMFRWLPVSLCGMIIGLEDLAIAQFSITNIEYIAYKNVYYTHAPLQSLSINNPEHSVRLCSNYCTLNGGCHAFFMETKASGNCHLVSESATQPRTIGYGQDTDNVYYVKSIVSTESRDVPVALKPPCDTDYKELDAATCGSDVPTDPVAYKECKGTDGASYSQTVSNVLDDAKCEGEDRLLLCELEGVESNLEPAEDNPDLYKPALMKASFNGNGFSTPTNKGFEWVKFNITLDNSGQMLKVQRLTVRMADVNKQLIMDGRVELLDTQNQVTETRNFTLPSVEHCLLTMHFGADGMAAKAVKLTALRM